MSLAFPQPARAAEPRAGVVWVHLIAEWFRSEERESSFQPWRPGLCVRDLAPPWANPVPLRNGKPAAMEEDVEEGDHVIFIEIPGFPVALFLALHPVLAGFLLLLVSSAASYVISRLLAPQAPAREPQDEASQTYNWSGIRTNYQPIGLPYPLVTGRHWTGGTVIQQYVETVQGAQPKSYLYLLIELSTGPVRSVAGIDDDEDFLSAADIKGSVLINGNPVTSLAGIVGWVRLGSLNQEPIAAFNKVRTPKDVDLPLDQVVDGEGTAETNWEHAVEVEFDGDADHCRIGLLFPRGLYQTTSGGTFLPERVEVQARYQPVSGGNWQVVYFGADDVLNIDAEKQGAFEYDAEFSFWDPATIVPPSASLAYELNRLVDLHRAESDPLVNVPGTPFLSDTLLLEMSIEFRMTTQVAGSGCDERVFSWANWNQAFGPPPSGMVVKGFLVRWITSPTNPSRADLEVYWGNGGTGGELVSWNRLITDTEHLAGAQSQFNITYKSDGAARTVRLYVDGSMRAEKVSGVGIIIPTDGLAVGCWNGQESSGNYAKVKLDELTIWGRELSAEEIVVRHDSGDWVELTRPDLDPTVLAAYRFNIEPTFGETFDWGSYEIHLGWLNGINLPEIVAGWTSTPASGAVLRDTYRVQVQRIDLVRGTQSGIADEVRLLRATAILDDEIAYAGLALLGLRIQATDQLPNSNPNVLTLVFGREDMPAWDGRDPDSPTFDRGWSRSPADTLALIATSREDGGGAYFSEQDIDWPAFAAWRDFCRHPVYGLSGKWEATELEVVNPTAWGFGVGDFDPPLLYQVTMAAPKPDDYRAIAGDGSHVRVKIVGVTDGPSGDWPEGVFEIEAIVVDGSEVRFVMQWPAGFSVPATNPYVASPAATHFRVQDRLDADFVFADRGLRFWGAVQMICATGRAAPILIGDRLSVVYQYRRDPVALFNVDNIIAGSFRVQAARREDQLNSAAAEIQDESLRNERTVIERRHSSLKDASSSAVLRHETFDMRGRTRAFQAARELDYQLNLSQGSNLRVEFDTFLEAAFVSVGDIAVIQYPLPTWSVGGKVDITATNPNELPIDVEVTLEPATTYYVAVRYHDDDQLAFVAVATAAGTYPAGTVLDLVANLPGGRVTPGDLWVLGTATFAARLFQLVDHRLTQDLMIHTAWAEYDDVFVTDDEGEPLESLMGHDSGGDATADQAATILQQARSGGGGYLASAAEIVHASELAYHDLKTGALVLALLVSWAPDPATEQRIARTRLWVEGPTGGRTLAAEVAPGVRETVLSGLALERNATYRVVVQHQAADGTRRDYSLCPSRRVTIYGLFTPPVSMASGMAGISAWATGDAATYEVTLPPGFEGASLQLYRGDTFIGQEIGSLPPGSFELVGTPDWYGGATGAPVMARLRAANGTRGAFLRATPLFAPPGYTLLAEEDYADGPWDTKPGGAVLDPVLTELEIEAPAIYNRLRWPTASASLSASYTGWETELTTAARRHVSLVIEGFQVFGLAPQNTLLGGLAPSDRRMASWTPQGPLDAHAPDYGALGLVIEWQRSTSSADPSGEPWEPFRSGPAYFRSARWRVSLTRPTSAWNVGLTRLSVAVRTIP